MKEFISPMIIAETISSDLHKYMNLYPSSARTNLEFSEYICQTMKFNGNEIYFREGKYSLPQIPFYNFLLLYENYLEDCVGAIYDNFHQRRDFMLKGFDSFEQLEGYVFNSNHLDVGLVSVYVRINTEDYYTEGHNDYYEKAKCKFSYYTAEKAKKQVSKYAFYNKRLAGSKRLFEIDGLCEFKYKCGVYYNIVNGLFDINDIIFRKALSKSHSDFCEYGTINYNNQSFGYRIISNKDFTTSRMYTEKDEEYCYKIDEFIFDCDLCEWYQENKCVLEDD